MADNLNAFMENQEKTVVDATKKMRIGIVERDDFHFAEPQVNLGLGHGCGQAFQHTLPNFGVGMHLM